MPSPTPPAPRDPLLPLHSAPRTSTQTELPTSDAYSTASASASRPALPPLRIPTSTSTAPAPAAAGGPPSALATPAPDSATRRRAHTVGVSLRARASSGASTFRTRPEARRGESEVAPAWNGRARGVRGNAGAGGLGRVGEGVERGNELDMLERGGGAGAHAGGGLDPSPTDRSRYAHAQGEGGGFDSASGEADDGERTPLASHAAAAGAAAGAGAGAGTSAGPDGGTTDRPSSSSAADAHAHAHPKRRSRGDSIVDRLRHGVASRERRDSASVHGEPVGYEVIHGGGHGGGSGARRSGESGRGRGRGHEQEQEQEEEEEDLGDKVVGMLDCIDPEVSTVNHLQNVTNSIFLPHFPALWSRRPEIVIEHDHGHSHSTARRGSADAAGAGVSKDADASADRDRAGADTGARRGSAPHTGGSTPGQAPGTRRRSESTVAALYPPTPTVGSNMNAPFAPGPAHAHAKASQPPLLPRITSIPSPIATTTTAAGDPLARKGTASPTDASASADETKLPHSLDLHVQQVLRTTKRERIVKGLKGLWTFLKTPMGIVVGIYGVLVVFWGAALVIILAGWIPMPNKWWQDRWVEICSQIVNGLFTITGVGLIPWRVKDTYHMVIVSKLKRRTHIKRKKRGLPPIEDPNDIPDPREQEDFVSVLTEREQWELTYHQEKFALSQTWYRPHATSTHTAFPITWALWNTVLMDLNSVFQCILCGCMWGLNQYQRPAWTTGSLIPLSFLCGIGAGVLIWVGGAKTKKRETVEDKLRAALGVPLAIALPQTKDGTYITGNNKATIDRNPKVQALNPKPKPKKPKKGKGGHGEDPPAGGLGIGSTPSRSLSRSRSASPIKRSLTHSTGELGSGDSDDVEKATGGGGVGEGLDGSIPLSKIVSPTRRRRATITIGNVSEPMYDEGAGAGGGAEGGDAGVGAEAGVGGGEGGRTRGSTVGPGPGLGPTSLGAEPEDVRGGGSATGLDRITSGKAT